MPFGEFVHVAGTLDDATGWMRIYVNGVLAAQTQTSVRPFRRPGSGEEPEHRHWQRELDAQLPV